MGGLKMSDTLNQAFGLNVTGLHDLERLNKLTATFNKNIAAVSSTSATFNEIGQRVTQTITGQIDKYRTLIQTFSQTDDGFRLVSQSMSVNTEAMKKNAEATAAAAEQRAKLLEINSKSQDLSTKVRTGSLKEEKDLVQGLIDKQNELQKLQKQRGTNVLVTEKNLTKEIAEYQSKLIKLQKERAANPAVDNIKLEQELIQNLIKKQEELKRLKETRSTKAVTKTEKKSLEEILVLENRLQEIRKQGSSAKSIEAALKTEKELTEKRAQLEVQLAETKKKKTENTKQENQRAQNILRITEELSKVDANLIFAKEKRIQLQKSENALVKEEEQTVIKLTKLREKLNKLQATREKKTGSTAEQQVLQDQIRYTERLQAIQTSRGPVENILKQKQITQELVALQAKLKNLKKTDPRNEKAIATLTEQINKTRELSEISKQTSLVVARATEKERKQKEQLIQQQNKQQATQEQLNRLNRETSAIFASTQKGALTAPAEINRQIQYQEQLNRVQKEYNRLLKVADLSKQQKDRIKGIQEEVKRQQSLAKTREQEARKAFEAEKKAIEIKKRRNILDQQGIALEQKLAKIASQMVAKTVSPESEINKQLMLREQLIKVEKRFQTIAKDPAASQQQKQLAQMYLEVVEAAKKRSAFIEKTAKQEIKNNETLIQQAKAQQRIESFQRRLAGGGKVAFVQTTNVARNLSLLEAQKDVIATLITRQNELNLLRRDPRLSQAQKSHLALMDQHIKKQRQAAQEAYKMQNAQLRGLQKIKTSTESIILSWKNAARVFQFIILHRAFMALAFSMRQGIEAAKELSIRIAEIRTISNRSISSTEDWATAIRSLSEQFGNDLLDTAAGTYEALSDQVIHTARNTSFLTEAMKLAVITVSDFQEASSASASILNAFNMAQTEAARVNAILFKTVDLGRMRLSEFASTIGRVSSLSDELGVSFLEQQAALAALTIQGVKSSRAETFLVNIFQKLIRPTDALKEIYREWGVTSGESAIKTFGFIGVMEKLDAITRKSGDRVAELGEIFQRIRATTGAAAFDIRLITDYINQMSSASRDAGDALNEVMDSAGKKAEIELTKLRNFFTVDLGKGLLDKIIEVSDAIGGMTTAIQVSISAVQTLVTTFASYFVATKATKFATGAAGLLQAVKAAGSLKNILLVLVKSAGFWITAITTIATVGMGLVTYFKAQTAILKEQRKELVANIKANFATLESLRSLTQAVINNNNALTYWLRNTRQIAAIFGQSVSQMRKQIDLFEKEFERAYKESTKETMDAFGEVIKRIEDRISDLDKIITDAKENIVKLNQDLDKTKFENVFKALGLQGAEGFQIIDNRLELLKQKIANLTREFAFAQFGLFNPQKLEQDKNRIIEIRQQIKDLKQFGGIWDGNEFKAADNPAELIKQLRQEMALLNADPITRIRVELIKAQQEQFRLNEIKRNQAQVEEDVSKQQIAMLQARSNELMAQDPFKQLEEASTEEERKAAEYRIQQIIETNKQLEQQQKEHNQKYGGDIIKAFELEQDIANKRIELIRRQIEAETQAAANAEKRRKEEQIRLQAQQEAYKNLEQVFLDLNAGRPALSADTAVDDPKEANQNIAQSVFEAEQQYARAIQLIQQSGALEGATGLERLNIFQQLQDQMTLIYQQAEAKRREIAIQEFNKTQAAIEKQMGQAAKEVENVENNRAEVINEIVGNSNDVFIDVLEKYEARSAEIAEKMRSIGPRGNTEELRKEKREIESQVAQINALQRKLVDARELTTEDIELIRELLTQAAQLSRRDYNLPALGATEAAGWFANDRGIPNVAAPEFDQQSANIGAALVQLEEYEKQQELLKQAQLELNNLQAQQNAIMSQIPQDPLLFAREEAQVQKQILEYITEKTTILSGFYADTIRQLRTISGITNNNNNNNDNQPPGMALGGFPRGADQQLAWVDRKEFIMNPEASATYRPILEALNGLRVPSRISNSTTNVGGINVTVNGGEDSKQTARSIAAELQREIRLGRISF
jgi:TP901 family phage tail tape measure protein